MADSIIQSGIDHHNFIRGGGTVLWQHDYNYPVAQTLRMNIVNGCMTALTQFPPEGISAQSDECYRLIRESIVNATSIGFQPIGWEFLDKNRPNRGVLFRKVELIEFSYVSCPANPDALIIGKSYPYHPGRREPSMRELGAQLGRIIVAARLRAALPARQTTYAERIAIARELRRGE